MARSRKGKGSTLKVDFTGVESSGNVQEGRHIAEVAEVELKTSDNTGNEYINWKLKAPGGIVYHTTSLQPQALWNLRNTLEALGLEVPDSSLELDLAEFPGMTLGIEVEHETYQGKKRPRVIDVFPEDEGEVSEEDEEEDEEEQVTYSDLEEMDTDELLEVAKDNQLKVPAKTKTDEDKLREFIAEKLELEEDEEDDAELTLESLEEMDLEELLEVAKENQLKPPAKVKKNEGKLRDFLVEKLELEGEEEEEEPAPNKKGKSKELKKGSKVSFEDDGEDMEGVVASINKKDGFAVVDIDGEEWEVELDDLTVI